LQYAKLFIVVASGKRADKYEENDPACCECHERSQIAVKRKGTRPAP
jgi:hypothetical protein